MILQGTGLLARNVTVAFDVVLRVYQDRTKLLLLEQNVLADGRVTDKGTAG